MRNFLKRVLLVNGVVDICVGAGLVFAPEKIGGFLSFSGLPDYASFFAGGWGVGALTLGFGRITASWDQKKWRLWSLLGLLEGSLLAVLCLRYWLGGVLTLPQVSIPLVIGALFALCYAAAYPSLHIVVKPKG
jgi:hypothetical protein